MSWYRDIKNVEHWKLNALVLVEMDGGDVGEYCNVRLKTGFGFDCFLYADSSTADINFAYLGLYTYSKLLEDKIDPHLLDKAALLNLVSSDFWDTILVDANDPSRALDWGSIGKGQKVYVPIILNNISTDVANMRGNKEVENGIVYMPHGLELGCAGNPVDGIEGDKLTLSLYPDGWNGLYVDIWKAIGIREGSCPDKLSRGKTLMHEFLHSAHRVSEVHDEMYGGDKEAVTEECIVHYVTDNLERLHHVRHEMENQPDTNFTFGNRDKIDHVTFNANKYVKKKYGGNKDEWAWDVYLYGRQLGISPVLVCNELTDDNLHEMKKQHQFLSGFEDIIIIKKSEVEQAVRKFETFDYDTRHSMAKSSEWVKSFQNELRNLKKDIMDQKNKLFKDSTLSRAVRNRSLRDLSESYRLSYCELVKRLTDDISSCGDDMLTTLKHVVATNAMNSASKSLRALTSSSKSGKGTMKNIDRLNSVVNSLPSILHEDSRDDSLDEISHDKNTNKSNNKNSDNSEKLNGEIVFRV